MKFIFILFILNIGTVYAQDAGNDSASASGSLVSPVTLWLTAGPAFSKLGVTHSDDDSHAGTRIAFSTGAEIEFPISPVCSIQTGLDFIEKGATYDDTPGGHYSLHYFEIPVLAKIYLPIGANSLAIMAGPYAAWAVTRSIEIEGRDEPYDISDSVKAWDLGLRFGAAYAMPIAERLLLTFGVNYDLGLLNINSNSTASSDNNVENRGFIAAVGVGLPF